MLEECVGSEQRKARVKARVCAKGLMRRFPQRGKRKTKTKIKMHVPVKRLCHPLSREGQGAAPRPQPACGPGGLAAAWHPSPSLEELRLGVRAEVCLARGSPASRTGCRLRTGNQLPWHPPRAGPTPRGCQKPPAPWQVPRWAVSQDGQRGARSVSQAHETGWFITPSFAGAGSAGCRHLAAGKSPVLWLCLPPSLNPVLAGSGAPP